MENNNITSFCKKILEMIPNSKNHYHDLLKEWQPDNPPVTTLFAFFGDEIANKFNNISQEEKERIFKFIEEGISSQDEIISTAVATGLIEAIISSDYSSIREEVLELFGNQSLYHAKCWLNLI